MPDWTQKYEFPDGSVYYGPGGHRKWTMTKLGWRLCVHFNSFLHWMALYTPIGRAILRASGRRDI